MVAGFKILNEAADPFPGTPFALPDTVDYDMLGLAVAGDGVVSGCAVTGSGSTNVAVAAGTVVIGGVLVTVASGNVAITSGHATLNRLDLVVVDNTGAKSAVAGTPAAGQSVAFPAIPANSVVLAAVWQPAAGTTVAANQVLDKRLFSNRLTAESGLLASRSANGTRVDGSTYFATDVAGGTLYRMVAGAWTAAGMGVTQRGRGQLDCKTLKVKTVFANGTNDITGWSITFTYQGLPVVATVYMPCIFFDSVDSRIAFNIVDTSSGGLVAVQRYYTPKTAVIDVTATTNTPGTGAATPDLIPVTLITEPRTDTADAASAAVAMVPGNSYTWKVQSLVQPGTAAANLNTFSTGFFKIVED